MQEPADTTIEGLAMAVLQSAGAAGHMIATAESCTGGMVAVALTAIAGSSSVVDRAFVTYSNEAKAEMIGVPMALIEAHGAVSEPVARAMAEGALASSRATRTVAITGIAGPGGGSPAKPVGLVHFAVAGKGIETRHHRAIFADMDRTAVRQAATTAALTMLLTSMTAGH